MIKKKTQANNNKTEIESFGQKWQILLEASFKAKF